MKITPAIRAEVECRTTGGKLLATIELASHGTRQSLDANEPAPLLIISPDEARRRGEQCIQLRERSRYEYRIKPAPGTNADLEILQQRGIVPSSLDSDRRRGILDLGDQCGILSLKIVRRNTQQVLAVGLVEVRSTKIGYRDHYRYMLSAISEKCAGLLLDCRAGTSLRFESQWRREPAFLEQQIEFLRHIISGPAFTAAVDAVLKNPHKILRGRVNAVDIGKGIKPSRSTMRQILRAGRRVVIPQPHPLAGRIRSLPQTIDVHEAADLLDTPENRFVKMVLMQFRDFFSRVRSYLESVSGGGEQSPLLFEVKSLRANLDGQLSRGFFPDISSPQTLPLGSSVLQGRSGYREILRTWINFYASSQIVWDAGPDVFLAGARNVADLYEYWTFFQLEELFRKKFHCHKSLSSVLVETETGIPRLKLRQGFELHSPVEGIRVNGSERKLRAAFYFNRKFKRTLDSRVPGSWSRGVQPDFTITIWPAYLNQAEAEAKELSTHIHFDAKYRVERVSEILGDDEIGLEESPTLSKYSDLLKMHAYRDAVRRTAGAYVLYPGRPGDSQRFEGFHEILPGLGAFALRPAANASVDGLEAVSKFLDEVITHFANRTTARERVTFHVSEAYADVESPIPTGGVELPEIFPFTSGRALPPAEHMVLLAWSETPQQLALAQSEMGLVYVRLGLRSGALHVRPDLAAVQSILMRSKHEMVAGGLLELREPGFRVYTRKQLRVLLKGNDRWLDTAGTEADEEYLYAVFKSKPNPHWAHLEWSGDKVMDLVEQFESKERHRPVENLGRTSPYPRILPLQELLKAVRKHG